jgi:ABC-type multidrug transport system fused ATPase/permease subunit
MLRGFLDICRKSYFLVRPYGLKRLAMVSVAIVAQALFQVLGVTSIFPFLAVAADPERIRNSQFGQAFLRPLPEMDHHQLLVVAGVFAIVMLLLANLVSLGGDYVRTRYVQGFAHWLRMHLLRSLTMQNYAYFLERNTGILIKKVLGDVALFSNCVLLPLLDVFARTGIVLLLLITLVWVHPLIALLTAIILAGYYGIVFVGLRRRRWLISEGLKESGRGVSNTVAQLLYGIKAIMAAGAESWFIDRFAAHSGRQVRLNCTLPLLSSVPRHFIEPLAFGGLVTLVLVVSARGQNLATYLPNLAVMALAGYRLLPAVQSLYGQLTGITATRNSLDEVYDEFLAFEQNPVVPTADQAATTLRWQDSFALHGVAYNYGSRSAPALHATSLAIPKNSMLAITGPTGSGKTTLIDIILGLLWPQAGELRLDGRPLAPADMPAWRRGIGYVPQEIFLFDDTLARNIAFGVEDRAIDPQRLRTAAGMAQILDFIDKELPQGFATEVGDRGVRLSGGQRQRIGLARALYREPELLILDEATSALDNRTEADLMDAIATLRGKLTIVLIAHRLSTVRHCDRIAYMENGAIQGVGAYDELLRSSPGFRDLDRR